MARGQKKKKVRKTLQFYRVFGVEPPFQILVDPEFIITAMEHKIYLRDELPKMLQERAYVLVTDCVVADLKARGEEHSGAALSAKRMQRHHCEHPENTSAHNCLDSLIEQRTRQSVYNCVAVQEPRLRSQLRHRGGVPIVYIAHNSLLLEPISDSTKGKADQMFHQHQQTEIAKVKAVAEKQQTQQPKPIDPNNNSNNSNSGSDDTSNTGSTGTNKQQQKQQEVDSRKRKAKAPNPLSVKKKHKKIPPTTSKPSSKNSNDNATNSNNREMDTTSSNNNNSNTANNNNNNNNNNSSQNASAPKKKRLRVRHKKNKEQSTAPTGAGETEEVKDNREGNDSGDSDGSD